MERTNRPDRRRPSPGNRLSSAKRVLPPIANHVSASAVDLGRKKRLQLTREALIRKLAEGDPPVDVGRGPPVLAIAAC